MVRIRGDFGRPKRVSDPVEQAKLDALYIKRLEKALSENGEDPRWSAVRALAAVAGITVVVLVALVSLLLWLASQGGGPESALSLVFVAAAVVLILVLCTLSIVFKRLRLEDAREAMGLPKGSVRAVIALMLILLFFIAAIFLFNSSQRDLKGATRQLVGLSSVQYATLDPGEILSSSSQGSGTDAVFTVTMLPALSNTASSDDIAKQLITTVGTLVTAVAAFYFGANSVSNALKEAREGPFIEPDQGGTGAGGQGGTGAGGQGGTGAGGQGETGAGGQGETGAGGQGETGAGGQGETGREQEQASKASDD
jgi:uncharacterized membrane protein YhaH (DUF805 family)